MRGVYRLAFLFALFLGVCINGKSKIKAKETNLGVTGPMIIPKSESGNGEIRSILKSTPGNDSIAKADAFPVVSKSDVLYYDISGVNGAALVVSANGEGVRGITATEGGCKVRSLVVEDGYLLDEDLANHCPLQNITLKADSYYARVDCDGANLTDDTLPQMPANTQIVFLNNNALRSVENLVKHLKPHKMLKSLVAERNQLDYLPRLPPSVFPNLQYLDLRWNKITEIDLDIFEELVARKKMKFVIAGNPFLCSCRMYSFKKLLLKLCKEGNEACNEQYMGLSCFDESKNKSTAVLHLAGDNCEVTKNINWWMVLNAILGLLNAVMIYLIVDLGLILSNYKGMKYSKRPKLDLLLCGLKSAVACVVCFPFRWQEREAKSAKNNDDLRFRNLDFPSKTGRFSMYSGRL